MIVFSASFLSLSLFIQSVSLLSLNVSLQDPLLRETRIDEAPQTLIPTSQGQMLLSREGSKAKLPISHPILPPPPPPTSLAPPSLLSVDSPQLRFEMLEPVRAESMIYITLAPPSPLMTSSLHLHTPIITSSPLAHLPDPPRSTSLSTN